MPANLPPEFLQKRALLREAQSVQEKIAILEQMLACVPKHKGTEKLQAEIKNKIAKLRRLSSKKKGPSHAQDVFFVKKEGAAQVLLLGPPNSGKSSLLSLLTNASPTIAPYPYTTRTPICGMMRFENIQIQLIDTPPYGSPHIEGALFNLVLYADLVALVVDVLQDPVTHLTNIIEAMKRRGLTFSEEKKEDERVKKAIVLVNKVDGKEEEELYNIFCSLYPFKLKTYPVSAKDPSFKDTLPPLIYKELELIRVYTKRRGEKPDLSEPIVLPIGAVVEDAALQIHKEFAYNLKYAKLYRDNICLKVHKDYLLKEGDILEFFI